MIRVSITDADFCEHDFLSGACPRCASDPHGGQEPPPAANRGEAMIVRAFIDAHRGKFLKVSGRWHEWDGKRWASDATSTDRVHLAVLTFCQTVVASRRFLDYDPEDRRPWLDVIAKTRNVKAVVEGLWGLSVDVGEMDADPYLLNTPEGTLDLRTRKVRPHDPADKLTRITHGSYRPGHTGPEWAKFLRWCFGGDEATVRGLQVALGQALRGEVTEHLFIVMHGRTRGGKGTTCRAVEHAMGDYAIGLVYDKVIGHGADRGGTEVADLRGARLAFMQESSDAVVLDDEAIKALTGGDAIRARDPYQRTQQFAPSHQLVLATNAHPQPKNGSDPAFWARIVVVPFAQSALGNEDVELSRRLQREADAVLTWLVDGYYDWLADGMQLWEAMRRAVAKYRHGHDRIRDCFSGYPGATMRVREAWEIWAGYLREQDGRAAKPGRPTHFAAFLEAAGYEVTEVEAASRNRALAVTWPEWSVDD